jgi:hypothetical protein
MDDDSQLLKAVQEIRDLMRLMAEPAIAERDKKLREELRRIIGKSALGAQSVFLMDGSRAQADIQRETRINQGNLSSIVKELKGAKLLADDGKRPKLAIQIPSNFFESEAEDE